MRDLCSLAEKNSYHVALAGASQEVRKRTQNVLQQAFPQLIFSDTPQVTFIALGAPKQEFVIDIERKRGSRGVYMGVGGAFDMISGYRRRAPSIMRKIGLEWLWRLTLQPSRISRIWQAIVVFPLTVLRYDR